MVTKQELDEAEKAVEVAEQKLDLAEAHHANAGSETAVTELRIARAASHADRDRLRQLRSRYASEQAKGRAREAAEQGFPAKARKTLTGRLAAAKDEAADAVAVAERAVAVLLEKVAAYDSEVRAAAADLKGRGLSADDGLDGGTAAGVVRLDGEAWHPTDPGSLLAAVASSAVAARDPRHPFGQQRWRHLGGAVAAAGRDSLRAEAGR